MDDDDIIDDADPLIEAASYAAPKIRYYESQNVRGILYRSIDEYKFLAQLKAQAFLSGNEDIIGSVWNYVGSECILIQYEHLSDIARDIKER